MCRGGLPPSSADGATVFGRAALVAGGAGEVAVGPGGGGRGALLWQKKKKWGWGRSLEQWGLGVLGFVFKRRSFMSFHIKFF